MKITDDTNKTTITIKTLILTFSFHKFTSIHYYHNVLENTNYYYYSYHFDTRTHYLPNTLGR